VTLPPIRTESNDMSDEQPKPMEHFENADIGPNGGTYYGTDEDGEPVPPEHDSWFGGVVVVDPHGQLAHLRHLDTTGHYDEGAGGNDADEG
jgi:hypothetical protein